MTVYFEYSLEDKIAQFFTKTFTTREACDEKAASLVGGRISPVPIQGDCSYTVYGGSRSQSVVQFRLQSLPLSLKITALAKKIHGNLIFTTMYHGQLGDTNRETVSVYSFDRIPGINYIEFCFANPYAEDSEENFTLRADFMMDLARLTVRAFRRLDVIDRVVAGSLPYHGKPHKALTEVLSKNSVRSTPKVSGSFATIFHHDFTVLSRNPSIPCHRFSPISRLFYRMPTSTPAT